MFFYPMLLGINLRTFLVLFSVRLVYSSLDFLTILSLVIISFDFRSDETMINILIKFNNLFLLFVFVLGVILMGYQIEIMVSSIYLVLQFVCIV